MFTDHTLQEQKASLWQELHVENKVTWRMTVSLVLCALILLQHCMILFQSSNTN